MVFGTTGEGASLGNNARAQVLEAFRGSGLDLERQLIVGLCATAAGDVGTQIERAHAIGVRRFLLPPPFYFKGLRSEGLEAWYRVCLDPWHGQDLKFLLYNIPSLTQVPLPVDLITRLADLYPGTVSGVKDSSGQWDYSRRLLGLSDRLTILIGDERHLARAVRLGAAGAISGCANFMPELLLPLVHEGRDDPRIHAIVDELLCYPVTPAVKALVAHRTGDDTWRRVAPPLAPLTDEESRLLAQRCDQIMRESWSAR